MAERLASLNDCKIHLKGIIDPGGEVETALEQILDGVSGKAIDYILGLPGASWILQERTEAYGNEHYGRHARNTIRLRHWPVASIASINDAGHILDSSEYVYSETSGVIYTSRGWQFTDAPGAVVIVYTAGYAETGAVEADRKLAVPDALKFAIIKQVRSELNPRETGMPDATYSYARPDGAITVADVDEWVGTVRKTIERYKRKFVAA